MLDGVRIQKFIGTSPDPLARAFHAFWITGPEWMDGFDQMLWWCEERHGPANLKAGVWHTNMDNAIIWFADENHALEFRMRWM